MPHNTYYGPLVQNCGTSWSNLTRWLITEILNTELNRTVIDRDGAGAAATRAAFNHELLIWSSLYSVICLGICGGMLGIIRWQRWVVPWSRLLLENLLFIVVLGLFEFIFFRTIIYKYATISTPELNMYIVDGLASCATEN